MHRYVKGNVYESMMNQPSATVICGMPCSDISPRDRENETAITDFYLLLAEVQQFAPTRMR